MRGFSNSHLQGDNLITVLTILKPVNELSVERPSGIISSTYAGLVYSFELLSVVGNVRRHSQLERITREV